MSTGGSGDLPDTLPGLLEHHLWDELTPEEDTLYEAERRGFSLLPAAHSVHLSLPDEESDTGVSVRVSATPRAHSLSSSVFPLTLRGSGETTEEDDIASLGVLPRVAAGFQNMHSVAQRPDMPHGPLGSLHRLMLPLLRTRADVAMLCADSQFTSNVCREAVALHAVDMAIRTWKRRNDNSQALAIGTAAEEEEEEGSSEGEASDKATLEEGGLAEADAAPGPEVERVTEVRDSGYTRPCVLILVPTRHIGFRYAQHMLALMPGLTPTHTMGLGKLEEELAPLEGDYINGSDLLPDDIETDTQTVPGSEPEHHVGRVIPFDWRQTFAGNSDDNFRYGLSIGKGGPRRCRVYGDIRGCDIVVASPLNLKLLLAQRGGVAILSSIHTVILDTASLLNYQSWAHVADVMEVSGGKCDCGDCSTMSPEGFCPNHTGLTVHDDPTDLTMRNGEPLSVEAKVLLAAYCVSVSVHCIVVSGRGMRPDLSGMVDMAIKGSDCLRHIMGLVLSRRVTPTTTFAQLLIKQDVHFTEPYHCEEVAGLIQSFVPAGSPPPNDATDCAADISRATQSLGMAMGAVMFRLNFSNNLKRIGSFIYEMVTEPYFECFLAYWYGANVPHLLSALIATYLPPDVSNSVRQFLANPQGNHTAQLLDAFSGPGGLGTKSGLYHPGLVKIADLYFQMLPEGSIAYRAGETDMHGQLLASMSLLGHCLSAAVPLPPPSSPFALKGSTRFGQHLKALVHCAYSDERSDCEYPCHISGQGGVHALDFLINGLEGADGPGAGGTPRAGLLNKLLRRGDSPTERASLVARPIDGKAVQSCQIASLVYSRLEMYILLKNVKVARDLLLRSPGQWVLFMWMLYQIQGSAESRRLKSGPFIRSQDTDIAVLKQFCLNEYGYSMLPMFSEAAKLGLSPPPEWLEAYSYKYGTIAPSNSPSQELVTVYTRVTRSTLLFLSHWLCNLRRVTISQSAPDEVAQRLTSDLLVDDKESGLLLPATHGQHCPGSFQTTDGGDKPELYSVYLYEYPLPLHRTLSMLLSSCVHIGMDSKTLFESADGGAILEALCSASLVQCDVDSLEESPVPMLVALHPMREMIMGHMVRLRYYVRNGRPQEFVSEHLTFSNQSYASSMVYISCYNISLIQHMARISPRSVVRALLQETGVMWAGERKFVEQKDCPEDSDRYGPLFSIALRLLLNVVETGTDPADPESVMVSILHGILAKGGVAPSVVYGSIGSIFSSMRFFDSSSAVLRHVDHVPSVKQEPGQFRLREEALRTIPCWGNTISNTQDLFKTLLERLGKTVQIPPSVLSLPAPSPGTPEGKVCSRVALACLPDSVLTAVMTLYLWVTDTPHLSSDAFMSALRVLTIATEAARSVQNGLEWPFPGITPIDEMLDTGVYGVREGPGAEAEGERERDPLSEVTLRSILGRLLNLSKERLPFFTGAWVSHLMSAVSSLSPSAAECIGGLRTGVDDERALSMRTQAHARALAMMKGLTSNAKSKWAEEMAQGDDSEEAEGPKAVCPACQETMPVSPSLDTAPHSPPAPKPVGMLFTVTYSSLLSGLDYAVPAANSSIIGSVLDKAGQDVLTTKGPAAYTARQLYFGQTDPGLVYRIAPEGVFPVSAFCDGNSKYLLDPSVPDTPMDSMIQPAVFLKQSNLLLSSCGHHIHCECAKTLKDQSTQMICPLCRGRATLILPTHPTPQDAVSTLAKLLTCRLTGAPVPGHTVAQISMRAMDDPTRRLPLLMIVGLDSCLYSILTACQSTVPLSPSDGVEQGEAVNRAASVLGRLTVLTSHMVSAVGAALKIITCPTVRGQFVLSLKSSLFTAASTQTDPVAAAVAYCRLVLVDAAVGTAPFINPLAPEALPMAHALLEKVANLARTSRVVGLETVLYCSLKAAQTGLDSTPLFRTEHSMQTHIQQSRPDIRAILEASGGGDTLSPLVTMLSRPHLYLSAHPDSPVSAPLGILKGLPFNTSLAAIDYSKSHLCTTCHEAKALCLFCGQGVCINLGCGSVQIGDRAPTNCVYSAIHHHLSHCTVRGRNLYTWTT
ncbi:digestive organ expansion factor, predicted [Kipferlia bialata]|uniref:Digestive organ expansion factor, predicted n=1 Tax=Kipferlia bialata TaxID=797122 RepID=A0A9K3CN96_9EUKA|nr:digestive organ expansion factor, predicted [Kipferlia bialata]|eukprot:g97.t1